MPNTTPYKYLPIISPAYRALRQFYRDFKYAGQDVSCPICQKTFNSWLKQVENGSCPACASASRHRLLWMFWQKYSRIFTKSSSVLHFAPEPCLENQLRKLPHLKYTTADLSAPGVDVHTNLTNLVFEDNSFDIIICSHVLEHIPDDRTAMREMYRVLAPGGIAYIQVPYRQDTVTDEDLSITDPAERARRFGQFDHLRVYGTDLQQRLESADFQVHPQFYAREIKHQDWQRYGLWDDIIFQCVKPSVTTAVER